MDSSKTSVLLVDHKFQPMGDIFLFRTSDLDDINDLRRKVRDEAPRALARADADASDLTVWRTKGQSIINDSNLENLANILNNINVDDKNTIERLYGEHKVADLILPNAQVLLVQLPAIPLNVHHPLEALVPSKGDLKYKDCFLQSSTKGNFVEGDFQLNGIEDQEVSDGPNVPDFVKKYEYLLGRKRKVAKNLRTAAETFIAPETAKEYFHDDPTMSPVSETVPAADQSEVGHLISMLAVGEMFWHLPSEGRSRRLKEDDANLLFFYAIAHHFRSLPSNFTSHQTQKIYAILGSESWPFGLIVQVMKEYCTYSPRSDFLVLKFDLPRVAVKVNSNPPYGPPVDYNRLIIQGASVVRFANTFVDAYMREKNFVFVAIFIRNDGVLNGVADRYLLFQTKDSPTVYCKKQRFNLKENVDLVRFALELYNISSVLEAENENEGTLGEVAKLNASVNELGNKLWLQTLDGNFKWHDWGSRAEPSIRGEQLEDSEYYVVPDVQTDGGTGELKSKLPSHIRTVYRRSDSNQTELIAKRFRKGTNELKILKYLRALRPQSPHVISLIETIPSKQNSKCTRWLVLPKLESICNPRVMNRGGVWGRVELGWGLIKGLAFLHEHKVAHLDIKPDNLVCDGVFCLKIIDFDVAIKVEDENTEINGYAGTKGWTAPEIGDVDGSPSMFSPIKADRWSCGRVLLGHIMIGKSDKRLLKLAAQLMTTDAQRRPSLLGWSNWSSDVANVPNSGGEKSFQPQQDMVKVDEESMKPPDAKRPRLTTTESGVQTELCVL